MAGRRADYPVSQYRPAPSCFVLGERTHGSIAFDNAGRDGRFRIATITMRLLPLRISSMPRLTLYKNVAQAPMIPASLPRNPTRRR